MNSEIKITCYHDSGIFTNGKIISFRDDIIHRVKNKECTLYGEYYQGVKWENNFRELLNDVFAEIYEVEDKKGRRLKIGDYTNSINGDKMIITKFEVADRGITVHGIAMVQSLAILGR